VVKKEAVKHQKVVALVGKRGLQKEDVCFGEKVRADQGKNQNQSEVAACKVQKRGLLKEGLAWKSPPGKHKGGARHHWTNKKKTVPTSRKNPPHFP